LTFSSFSCLVASSYPLICVSIFVIALLTIPISSFSCFSNAEYEFVGLRAQLKSVWQGQIRLETKDYHIERSDVEEDIEILRQAEEEFWQKVEKRQQPHLILPEI
jgi:hypothetical protein